MNLNYTTKKLAELTNAKLIGDAYKVIQNISTDSRLPIIQPNSLFIALKGRKSNGHEFCTSFVNKGGQVILVTEKQNLPNTTQLIVENTLIALQKIAEYHRQQFNIPVIGITGSNGKTIVKEWLFHTLKDYFNICRSPKSYNSQLGVALSVLELNKSHTLAIFEAGISKPNEMGILQKMILPTIGVYTGIGDAHQSNFDSLEQKEKEKLLLFKTCISIIDNSSFETIKQIPFSDLASQRNAKLVEKTAKLLKIDKDTILKKLNSLPSISMRLEKMEGKNGNIIINDTYSLDDKSLEISIQLLKSQNNNNDQVIIIAPHEVLSIRAKKMLESVSQVVVIGQSLEINNQSHHYNSSDDFLKASLTFKNSNILVTGAREARLEKVIPSLVAKTHITKLQINLAGIRRNLNYFRSKISENTMVLAMVKAQSYGGGIVDVAQFLESEKVNYFGVAYADEGLVLRENNITTPILVMNPEQLAFDDMIAHNLEPSIYNFEVLNQFIGALIRRNIKAYPIHLKVETGMNRLGFKKSDLNELIAVIKTQPEVYVKSVFSHLAVADDLSEKEFTNWQLENFVTTIRKLQQQLGYDFIKHITNSEGTLNFNQSHFDMIRLGIGLYGLMASQKDNLEQVLSFETQISQVSQLKKGETVGYGRAFTVESDTTIAVIPVGYADGLKRQLSQGKWQVLINESLVPIIGNICMDMCMVNITNLNCKIGDIVQIFGPKNTVFEMAEALKTIPYEIISSISSRVHRVYIEE